MPTPEKARRIDELAEQLSRAKLAILTDYRGLEVDDLAGAARDVAAAQRGVPDREEHADADRGREGRESMG